MLSKNIENLRVRRFILHQLQDISQGGFPVIRKKLFLLTKFTIALPVVICARILKPFVLIRFGQIWSCNIGHFAGNTEVYLCERDAGLPNCRTLDIFYHKKPISNFQLKKMWDRTLHTWSFAYRLFELNRFLPGGKVHEILLFDPVSGPKRTKDRDVDGYFQHTSPHLSFTTEEEDKGLKLKREMGIPDTASFICFHARDNAYLDAVFPEKDTSWNNYRDCNIENYVSAVKELTQRGYYAVRMGAVVKKKLQFNNQRIIDYAANGCRSDFMDIYLAAKCRFFLCDTAGIYSIASIFRKPVAFVNYVPLEYIFTSSPNFISIPKKLWLRDEKRFLTFREILDSGIGRFSKPWLFDRSGIELIENTPTEIFDLAIEMEERIKGTWQINEEDEYLQQRFWSLFKQNELNKIFTARIGIDFLRQNQQLLD